MILERPIAAALPDAAWIGKLPSDWRYAQLRRLLHVQSGDFISAEAFVSSGYPVFGGNGFRGYATDWNTETDTLLIGRYGALCGNVHHVRERVWATEHAFRVIFRKKLDVRFMYFLLQCVNLNQYSARAAQPGLNSTIVEERCVPVPPAIMQKAISGFLDRETAKIDALIASQTEFLMRLDEHRRTLITEAITRGLDPLVLMRETGVETFPVVPAHWQVRPLKHVIRRGTSISYGIVQPGDHDPDGVPFVQTADLTQRRLDPNLLPRTAPEIARAYPRSRLCSGDVLLGIRASVGDSVVVPVELDGANLSRGIARIVPSSDLNPNYLVLVLSSPQTAWFWMLYMQGSTFREVSIETVRQLPIPAPPRHEQDSIVCYLQGRLVRFDFARDRSIEIIERLRERRVALITAAVTGQIDVTEPALTEAAA